MRSRPLVHRSCGGAPRARARSRAWAAVTVALAGQIGLTGCASGPASTQGPSSSSTSPQAQVTPAQKDRYAALAKLGYRPEWNAFAAVPKGTTALFVDEFSDIITVLNSAGVLSVLETTTGARRWSLQLGGPLTRFVGLARREDGTLLVASQSEVYLLDARTGVITDRQRLAVLANTRPLVSGPMVLFGCATGELLGHNLSSGYKLWGYALDSAISADLRVVGESVAAVSDSGEVLFVDPRSGSSRGRARIFAGPGAAPASNVGALFIAGRDQSLWAFEPSSQSPLWRARTDAPLTSAPFVYEGKVILTVPGLGLCAFEEGTGARVWASKDVGGDVLTVRDGRLVVWDGARVFLVAPADGAVAEQVDIPAASALVASSPREGTLYILGAGGQVQKFMPSR